MKGEAKQRRGRGIRREHALGASAEGGRVAYTWDTTLEEWYENDTRGLEHGYTVHSRPARDERAETLLTLTIAVRGELRAEVDGARRGVRFLDEGGAVILCSAMCLHYNRDSPRVHYIYKKDVR